MHTPSRILLRGGQWLYEDAYFLYRPLYFAWKRRTDRRRIQMLRKLALPGSIAVDAGANIGFYTRLLSSSVRPQGTVYAFEPSPANFAKLTRSVGGASNVKALPYALGSGSGTTPLYLSPQINVDNRTYDPGQEWQRIDIPQVSLDEMLAEDVDKVSVLKIDVQGFEVAVLSGATQVLRRSPNIAVLCEFWPAGLRLAGSDPTQLFSLLRESGLAIFMFTDDGRLQLVQEALPESNDENQYWDLLAVPAKDGRRHHSRVPHKSQS